MEIPASLKQEITERIHTTSQWGAHPAKETFHATMPTDIILHHMDTPNRGLIEDSIMAVQFAYKLVRQCQENHMNQPPYGNGWADTGQNFTITRDGVILEGRHGSLNAILQGVSVQAAHCADFEVHVSDNNSPGIEHEGAYTKYPMPDLQWSSSRWLTACIAICCNLDTATVKGHRDTGCRTACPGDWFHSQLDRYREECHGMKLIIMRKNGML